MSRRFSIILISTSLLCATVFAAVPIKQQWLKRKPSKQVAHVKKQRVVNLGKPINVVALDTVLSNGHMSVVLNEGQFAEVLFQPFTRTRYQGALVPAEQVPDGQRMVVWGKWDRNNPNVFKALAVSCREHLTEVAIRQKVALACQNISQGRTLASIPEAERRVVIMTAPAPSVTLPEATTAPVAVAPSAGSSLPVVQATTNAPITVSDIAHN